jgi:WD repeat-containing protein 1 (actin-interacting protein 1)
MVAGRANAIAFSEDGKGLITGGEGKDAYAKAVITESGTKQGDLFGPTNTVNSIDVKGKRLIIGGENQEVFVFDGVPYKFTKTIKTHTNFINKVAFRADGKFFISVSSDKSIVLYDTETLEVVRKIDKAHNKGIIDAIWINDAEIVTCSSDNEVKYWNIETGAPIR